MSKMYKKHYDLIATVLAKAAVVRPCRMPAEAVEWLAVEFSKALEGTSPDYDAARFLAAYKNAAAGDNPTRCPKKEWRSLRDADAEIAADITSREAANK